MGTAPKCCFKIQKGNKQELSQYQGKAPAEKVAERRKPSLKKKIEPMDLCLSTGGAGRGECRMSLSQKSVEQRDFEALSEHLLLG